MEQTEIVEPEKGFEVFVYPNIQNSRRVAEVAIASFERQQECCCGTNFECCVEGAEAKRYTLQLSLNVNQYGGFGPSGGSGAGNRRIFAQLRLSF